MTTVADVVEAMNDRYDPSTADDWDAVGLVCGEPAWKVNKILFAVDAVDVVVDEAVAIGANLIVTHHPLYLRGVTSVSAATAKGSLVHRLIKHDIALFTAHTNADHAKPGVSDALANVLGLVETRPLRDDGNGTGPGRIGELPTTMTLADFADHVANLLPSTQHGIRVAGDLDAEVRAIAVCGGAGDAFLNLVADADVYVTSDLRHHRALEHREDWGCALVDVAHWASEWPWLAQAAELLAQDLQSAKVEIVVSAQPTDPWSSHVRSRS